MSELIVNKKTGFFIFGLRLFLDGKEYTLKNKPIKIKVDSNEINIKANYGFWHRGERTMKVMDNETITVNIQQIVPTWVSILCVILMSMSFFVGIFSILPFYYFNAVVVLTVLPLVLLTFFKRNSFLKIVVG